MIFFRAALAVLPFFTSVALGNISTESNSSSIDVFRTSSVPVFKTVGDDMVYEVEVDQRKLEGVDDVDGVYYDDNENDNVKVTQLNRMRSRIGMSPISSRLVMSPTNRQTDIWSLVNSLDGYKQSAMWESVNGVRTLKRMKYMILPVWWSDQDPDDEILAMNPTKIENMFETVTQHYTDMSWGAFDLSIEILPQTQLLESSMQNPDMSVVNRETKSIITDTYSKVSGTDYDGVVTIYWKAHNGNLSNGGGWGSVNGVNMWMTYYANTAGLNFAVTRHEVGHNFGHPHHGKNLLLCFTIARHIYA